MKICMISDTHGLHRKLSCPLPTGDVLIHAGDMTNVGRLDEIKDVALWLRSYIGAFKYVIAIAGNHDFGMQAFMREDREDLLRDIFGQVYYLRDSAVTLGGVKFYGSPWQPFFQNWAFNLPRGSKLTEKWAMIPQDTDVLVTHGPPLGIRDRVCNDSVGCYDLRQAVEKVKPKVHVFGHVHSSYGTASFPPYATQYFNAAVCNEKYEPVNKPLTVEI